MSGNRMNEYQNEDQNEDKSEDQGEDLDTVVIKLIHRGSVARESKMTAVELSEKVAKIINELRFVLPAFVSYWKTLEEKMIDLTESGPIPAYFKPSKFVMDSLKATKHLSEVSIHLEKYIKQMDDMVGVGEEDKINQQIIWTFNDKEE